MKHLHHFRPGPVLALGFLLWSSPSAAEVRVGGFTDLSWYATDDDAAETNSGFKEGQFVLHLNSSLSDRLNFFGEITWTPRSDGFGTEIERAILTYRHNDWFKPSAGRFHTPVSWWNVAFHHGAWLQTSVDRPIPVKFGSKFTPVHFVGAMVDGTTFPGGLSLSYTGGVGNGRGSNVARAGDAGDVNNSRAALVRVSLRHDAIYPLQVGGSVYFDKFPIAADPGAGYDASESDERMLSAFVVYESEAPELIAEFFHILHEDAITGEESSSTSWYAQLAWRLPFWGEKIKPYGRIEAMDIDASDRGFAGEVPDLRRVLGGIRVDVAAMVALKFEGRRYREGEDSADNAYVNEIYTSLSLAF